MILFDKLTSAIGEIKKDVLKIPDLVPDEQKDLIKMLIKEAVIAYGRAMINEAMKSE